MEEIELRFQEVEELGEVDVLGVPLGEGIGHGYLVQNVEDAARMAQCPLGREARTPA